jgi:phage-related minor tail protein
MSKVERDAKDIADAIRGDLSNSITDVIMDVESLSDAFASLAEQIARTIIQQQIAGPLAQGLTSFATQSIGSMFGGSTAGTTTANIQGFSGSGLQGGVSGATMLGPPAANGGNVFSNKAHLVGERGPELFVPGQDGRIIPNTEMGGGGDVTVNIINQGGERLEAQQQSSRRGPNGEQTVDVMVKSSIERLDGQGQLDGVFRRHGAARQGQF